MELLRRHADGRTRCGWCSDDPVYVRYHDREWGYPPRQDKLLFEHVCLEGFQSGLSWLTILRKRANFRAGFDDFEIERVARYGKRDVTRLLRDVGIVRNRAKIESALQNARRALELIEEHGSLARYFARYRVDGPFGGRWASESAESKALSKDLKKRGWSFVGPTTMYAFMQAVGLINDHAEGCDFRAAAERARGRLEAGRGPRGGESRVRV